MQQSPQQTQNNQQSNSQPQQQQYDLDNDFIVLQPLSAQQQQKLKQQRLNQLTQFYTTNKQYQITSWYQPLQTFTFISRPTQLTAIDAYILYWLYYNDHDVTKMQLYHKELYEYYQSLIKKIDTFLLNECKKFLTTNGQLEYFMKLATRSPKDLGYKYSQHQIQEVAIKLTQYLKQHHPQYIQINHQLPKQFINSIYRFFLDLSKQKFKIKSGTDFIQTFSTSQRIIIDISDFSFIKQDVFTEFEKNQFDRALQPFIQLWAREWKDFQWYQQMRCFYHDYKLTAITQYDQRCYFKELQDKMQLIVKEVQGFFDSLKPYLQKLELHQGVMDIVMFNLGKNQLPELKLIEINVFNRNSRASLFSWERDYDILTGKLLQKPELRILTQTKVIFKDQVKRLMGMIEKGTDQIISMALQNLGLKELWQKLQ